LAAFLARTFLEAERAPLGTTAFLTGDVSLGMLGSFRWCGWWWMNRLRYELLAIPSATWCAQAAMVTAGGPPVGAGNAEASATNKPGLPWTSPRWSTRPARWR
jgi:hypothetical protein